MTKSGSDIRSQAVIIAGMHRSGTSLTASILQHVGIDIGQKLMGSDYGNVRGHFEDIDFWELHQDILISQGISAEGWTTTSQVEVPQQFLARAIELRDSRMQKDGIWGWKEPRTTLFLDFWETLIPEAKYVLVYREPWEVINSLFARGDKAFINNPRLAVDVWIAYNIAILNCYKRNPSRSTLIHVRHLQGLASGFIDLVRTKLQLQISPLEKEMFDDRLMHSCISFGHREALLEHFFPKAIEVFRELNELADLPSQTEFLEPFKASDSSDNYRDWVLQDWLVSQRANASINYTQAELQQTQAELQQTQAELQQTQAELQDSQTELQHTQAQLKLSIPIGWLTANF
jgi:hypothetical protein